MEAKKTPKADLESKRGIFTQLGYVIVLGLVLLAFEWSTRPEKAGGLGQMEDLDVEEEIIPITRQKEVEPPPPPPPPKTTEVINIVDDDVEIEDELILEDTEADQETEIEIVEFDYEEEEEGDEQEVFFVVEDMPTFQGEGKEAFRRYIQQNLKYPPIAAENGISGRVFVSFVIDTDGSITNAKVVRGVDPSLDREALRVITNAPKWAPGKQRGRPVRVAFTFPIVFELQ